ncbi:MAG: nitrilase family protein [Cyclobacteriaceae bacterium]|nr:nitrilase family protein [Cyclobacteriaceae bacterium]
MKEIVISTAQFEHRSGDKKYNLSVIEHLATRARDSGARVVSFHELSITGYTFLKDLNVNEINDLSEEVQGGPSIRTLQQIAGDLRMVILAGLVERHKGKFYNTYVAVDGKNILGVFRKLHPFISKYLQPGDSYQVFELSGWRCSILICYDNNIVENVRAVALQGTQILFTPHVTGGTPSPMPGRGNIPPELWENREKDPEALRKEFLSLKGREWLMRWLPSRAYDNGIFVVFSNNVGLDHDHIKPGNAMIIDPFGEILVESNKLDNDVITATCTPEKLGQAGGYRYINARRPELYKDIIGKPNQSVTRPAWMKE